MANKEYKTAGDFSDVRIGLVADIFGLSDEAVRKYEQNDLIFPNRAGDSQYRAYDFMDIVMMLYSRQYKEFGFSVRETSNLVNECNIQEIKDAYERQRSLQIKKIELIHQQLNFMEKISHDIERIPELVGRCELSENPGIFRLEFSSVDDLISNPKRVAAIKQWISFLPFTVISTVYKKEAFEKRVLNRTINNNAIGRLGILEEYAEMFLIQETDLVQYYTPVPSVHTITHGNNMGLVPQLNHVYAFMEEHNIHVAGNAISFGIACNNFNTDFDRYCHLWIPYEKN